MTTRKTYVGRSPVWSWVLLAVGTVFTSLMCLPLQWATRRSNWMKNVAKPIEKDESEPPPNHLRRIRPPTCLNHRHESRTICSRRRVSILKSKIPVRRLEPRVRRCQRADTGRGHGHAGYRRHQRDRTCPKERSEVVATRPGCRGSSSRLHQGR